MPTDILTMSVGKPDSAGIWAESIKFAANSVSADSELSPEEAFFYFHRNVFVFFDAVQ